MKKIKKKFKKIKKKFKKLRKKQPKLKFIYALDTQVKKNADAIGTVKGYTVNGKAIDTNPILNGGDIALTNYSAVTGGAITALDTVNQAINILENQLIWHEA